MQHRVSQGGGREGPGATGRRQRRLCGPVPVWATGQPVGRGRGAQLQGQGQVQGRGAAACESEQGAFGGIWMRAGTNATLAEEHAKGRAMCSRNLSRRSGPALTAPPPLTLLSSTRPPPPPPCRHGSSLHRRPGLAGVLQAAAEGGRPGPGHGQAAGAGGVWGVGLERGAMGCVCEGGWGPQVGLCLAACRSGGGGGGCGACQGEAAGGGVAVWREQGGRRSPRLHCKESRAGAPRGCRGHLTPILPPHGQRLHGWTGAWRGVA